MDESIDLKKSIKEFLNDTTIMNSDSIYNEFSLQFELGFFLREHLKGCRVQFEKNVEEFGADKQNFIKKEMDLVVLDEKKSKKYAIELKFPTNGFYKKRMYHFVKDIQFMEQVKGCSETKGKLDFDKTYCLTIISDSKKGKGFRDGKSVDQTIAKYFIDPKESDKKNEEIHGKIPNEDSCYDIAGRYSVEWKPIGSTDFHYYLIEIPDDSKIKIKL